MFASLYAKLIGGAIVLAVIGGGVTWWSVKQYDKGYAAAIAAIAAQDKEAVDAVNKTVSDIDACVKSGGVWRQSSSQCEGR